MENLKKEAIRIIDLWRRYGPGSAKIDLNLILNEIVLPSSNGDQCKVVFEKFDSFEGLMARQEGSHSWTIGVNTNIEFAPRRNFTFAHEIGHFVGHRYKKNTFRCTFENLQDYSNIVLEKEANEFAAQILMPADVMRGFDKTHKFTHASVTELSQTLGVSRSAAAYRWVSLSRRKIGFAVSRDGMICHGRASEFLYKAGVFFKSGVELPAGSVSAKLRKPGESLQVRVSERVWHENQDCEESASATEVGEYIYTYLDFGS
ncbi:ImmA/IrrE family metallo-endopeptidase [Neorhizobium sp. LjRoot104]|uniref:ImmA/IrrE family metallo-endopeptidase n=1 Tax=Neorhizobium sp. LjRoot104 TaxID=3342254 RepID=UPI003ECC3461